MALYFVLQAACARWLALAAAACAVLWAAQRLAAPAEEGALAALHYLALGVWGVLAHTGLRQKHLTKLLRWGVARGE